MDFDSLDTLLWNNLLHIISIAFYALVLLATILNYVADLSRSLSLSKDYAIIPFLANWTQSKSKRNIPSANKLHTGASNNEINDLVAVSSFHDERNMDSKFVKRLKFLEHGHSFERSKSWAKYHGSHSNIRQTRVHRRSRSDLGGLLQTSTLPIDIGINCTRQNMILRRSARF